MNTAATADRLDPTHAPAAGYDPDSWWRLNRAFLVSRAVLGSALVALQFGADWLSVGRIDWVVGFCALYALLAVAQAVHAFAGSVLAEPVRTVLGPSTWVATVGVDVVIFTVLMATAPTGAPVAALYVLPVLMAGSLYARRSALAAAALATLGLLGASLWLSWAAPDVRVSITQAGLAGMGYFAVALLAAELAARVARQEQVAQGSLHVARQQTALNRLVIDEMQEGVLVVDRELQVRAVNPAAAGFMTAGQGGRPAHLAQHPAWAPLASAARQAWAWEGDTPQAVELSLQAPQGESRNLRLRWRRMKGESGGLLAPGDARSDLLVMLLEDRATLLARARQERLAAMGRMSAGIAHEIRNPLAAIAQANALLAEDLQTDRSAARLTTLVASNVKRLQRIVDEVMLLAAPPEASLPTCEARQVVAEVVEDWMRTQPQAVLRPALPPASVSVLFEPDHLRRVLVNLLDNAWRHAHETLDPWVDVELGAAADGAPMLWVSNPGAALPVAVERHLFEPFYSARSRGSGLGLYICRELCERYGARIEYRPGRRDGQPVVQFGVRFQSGS